MKKARYKDQNEKNYKKILIVLFVMIFILMLASSLLEKLNKEEESQVELTYDNLSSIKEVIEYYESKYISENTSSESGFYLDVYLKFKVLPYEENDDSNEEYYNKLLEDCAKIINYSSFRMIDNENDITIQVICNGSKITSIIINDIEDYFIYMDSQIALKKYEEIEITNFNIESEILQTCIDSNWSSDIYLGERDSIFDEYYIYFDEGIRARTIEGKIYNIIFDKNYKENIVEGLFPGVDLNTVKAKLGEPTFSDDELDVIGYKGEKVYIFFTEKEISVYRVGTVDADDFFELADKFIDEELDLLEFMNQLTYIWPDYSDYDYSSTSVFISYPLKGVEIRINSGDTNGILVYNNIKSTLSKTSRYLENTNFVSRLQIDLVYEAEKRRFEEEENLLNKCKEYRENLDEEKIEIIGESLSYDLYPEKDNNGYIYTIKFISKFGENPNRELNDSISTYLWLTNDYFLYSKEGKGIYFYNLNDGIVQRIITGNDEYELKGYENGILKYDEEEIELNF